MEINSDRSKYSNTLSRGEAGNCARKIIMRIVLLLKVDEHRI